MRFLTALIASTLLLMPIADEAEAHHKSRACKTYDVPETDFGWWKSRRLIRQGWIGAPSDGAERLYSPRCFR